MLEFMLSRLTMSICAIIVLLTLAPWAYSLPQAGEVVNSLDSLEELASRFDEVATAPGEAKLELAVRDYLQQEGDRFILRQNSLWFVNKEIQNARPIPEGFRIYVSSGIAEVEVEEAQLEWASMLSLSKHLARNQVIMEVHIENLEATSETFSPNLSTSSMLL